MQSSALRRSLAVVSMAFLCVLVLSCLTVLSTSRTAVAEGDDANQVPATVKAIPDHDEYDEESIIVVYEDEAPDMEAVEEVVEEAGDAADAAGYGDLSTTEQALADAGVTEEEELPSSDEEAAIAMASVPEGTDVEDLCAELEEVPGVASAQPNYSYHLVDEYVEASSVEEATEAAADLVDGTSADTATEPKATDAVEAQVAEGEDSVAATDVSDAVESDEEPDGGDSDDDVVIDLSSQVTNDTYCNNSSSTYNQYYLFNSGAVYAWDYLSDLNVKDRSVTVAVLDTGCDMNHPDLLGNLDTTHAWDVITGSKLTTSSAKYDGDVTGHGTHVAGIIAGVANNSQGIAGSSYNKARVLPIRVFNDSGSCKTSDLIKAFSYLDDLIEEDGVTGIRVINMSLGYYSTSGVAGFYDKKVESWISHFADEHGILTVCAGGNGDSNGNAQQTVLFPSDFESSFSVTSLDRNGANSSFSDYNASKDISAPGSYITSTYTNSTGYVRMSGTSMASPLVAGISAMLFACDDDLSVGEVRSAITSTATKVTGNAHASSGSAGCIDACAALAKVAGLNASSANASSLSVANASVTIESMTYTGSALKPDVTVKMVVNGKSKTLTKGIDYAVSFSNNVKPGTGKATVMGKGSYSGSKVVSFAINKKAQSISGGTTAKKLKYKKVKKKAQSFSIGCKASGKLSYQKTSGNAKVSVSSSGVVTVAKKTKKGTYVIKVKVSAAATSTHRAASTTKTITIKVK